MVSCVLDLVALLVVAPPTRNKGTETSFIVADHIDFLVT